MTLTISFYDQTFRFQFSPEDADLVRSYDWTIKLTKDGRAYARSTRLTGSHYLHRLIMGAKAGEQVDHIDRDMANNRRSNLRITTVTQNNRNRGRHNTEGRTSQFKGVHQDKGKYRAQIRAGKMISLGTYPDARTAAHAYDAASVLLHGRHGLPNLRPAPDDDPEDMPLDHVRLASRLYAVTVSALPGFAPFSPADETAAGDAW